MRKKAKQAIIFVTFVAFGFVGASSAGEIQRNFEDPREAIRFLISTLQKLSSPTEVTQFKHLFDPEYFEKTEPRAIRWDLAPLTEGKILWIATEGDGDIALAAIQTKRGETAVFAFALTEIIVDRARYWVVRPPGKQDPFSATLRPWHNRRTIAPPK